MSNTIYSSAVITKDDLWDFAKESLNILSATDYIRKYQSSLITIALCQGGANHYVVSNNIAKIYFDSTKMGLKDIDVWFFFKKKGFHPRWRMNSDYISSKFGQNPNELQYSGRRMDFIGRSISFFAGDTEETSVQRWLKNGKRETSPWYLAQKAVVAIYPKRILGDVFWVNPNLL